MKKIIIIGTYPSNKYSEEVLVECIDIFSNSGYDIMLTSHLPIPTYIQEKVDYFIYDKENILLEEEFSTVLFTETSYFKVEVKNKSHLLTVSKNIHNGVNLCKNLGYEFFYFTECDNLISETDLNKLEFLRKSMFEEDKKMIAFQYVNEGYHINETLIFGGCPKYFIKNIKLPITKYEFLNYISTTDTSLEKIFYNKTKNQNSNFLLIDVPSYSFFSESKINKISHDYCVEVIGNDRDDSLILWLTNFSHKNIINFKINGGNEFSLVPREWFFDIISLDKNLDIDVEINDNGYITHKKFEITEDNLEYYKNKGTFKYK
jgi:hypothetical protein